MSVAKRIGIGVLGGILALVLLVPTLAFAADGMRGSKWIAGTCWAAAKGLQTCAGGYAANSLDAYSGIHLNSANDTNDAYQRDRYEGSPAYYGGGRCGGGAFLDADGDGVCDNYGSRQGLGYRGADGYGVRDGYGDCPAYGYRDADGDGVCDNFGTGQREGGFGRGCRR